MSHDRPGAEPASSSRAEDASALPPAGSLCPPAGSECPPAGSECPSSEQLGLLVRNMIPLREQEDLERHVAECAACERVLTRLVDERREDERRRRRFPWVPVVAGCTVLIACSIAWLLSGGGRSIRLAEPGYLLGFDGRLEFTADVSRARLAPAVGLALAPGDHVNTPDRASVGYFLSTAGVLYRYDSRGETRLAQFGPQAAVPDPAARRAELDEVAAEPVRADRPGITPRAPRGNVLGQRPRFEVTGVLPKDSVLIEIREEEPRIRMRWRGQGRASAFPASGRSLERGRTFFWKAEGMPNEQPFSIATAREFEEWEGFRAAVSATGIPHAGALILELRYLLNRGFHLDALARAETVCGLCGNAAWLLEEKALVLDRLGRVQEARDCLERARGTAAE